MVWAPDFPDLGHLIRGALWRSAGRSSCSSPRRRPRAPRRGRSSG